MGLILCAAKGEQAAEYALEGTRNKMLATQYQTELPEPTALAKRLLETRERIEDLQAQRALVAEPAKRTLKKKPASR